MENKNRHLPILQEDNRSTPKRSNVNHVFYNSNKNGSSYNNSDFLYASQGTKFEPNFLGKIVLLIYRPVLICLAFYLIYLVGDDVGGFLIMIGESSIFKGFSFILNFLDAISILLFGVGFFTLLAFFTRS